MIKSKFTFFKMEVKVTSFNTVKFSQSIFTPASKILYAIDMIFFTSRYFTMINSFVFVAI